MQRTITPTTERISLEQAMRRRGPKPELTYEICDQAYKYALLGLTNKQMAGVFNKDETTIEAWYRKYLEFHEAVERGRKHADGEVVNALYHRAIGYEHEAVKFFKVKVTEKEYDPDGKVVFEKSYDKIIEHPYTKHYPPDVKAATKWLGVRNRDTWGESIKHDHRHAHAHLVKGEVDMNITHVLEEISDPGSYSDEELETLVKIGMGELAKKLKEDE